MATPYQAGNPILEPGTILESNAAFAVKGPRGKAAFIAQNQRMIVLSNHTEEEGVTLRRIGKGGVVTISWKAAINYFQELGYEGLQPISVRR